MTDKNSIGLLELSSIAAGMLAADTMLKTSNVELLLSRSICSGKYMVLIGGDVAAVKSAVDTAAGVSGFSVIDSFIIPNIDEQIFPAISGHTPVMQLESLGIVETFSVAACIEAADAAVKAANIQLIELRLAMALGGKAFFTCTGEVAAVNAAVEAGAAIASQKGLLVNKVIIAAPRQELLGEMI
ncbi:MAG: BMC domain-containing protein [Bacteroidota bacterium]